MQGNKDVDTISAIWDGLDHNSQQFWLDTAMIIKDDVLCLDCPSTMLSQYVAVLGKGSLSYPENSALEDMLINAHELGLNAIKIFSRDWILSGKFLSQEKLWKITGKKK